jgi:RHS repeat-associated protein
MKSIDLVSNSSGVSDASSMSECVDEVAFPESVSMSVSSSFSSGSQLLSRTVNGVVVSSPQVFDVWGRVTSMHASLTADNTTISSLTYRADNLTSTLTTATGSDTWTYNATGQQNCHRQTTITDTTSCGNTTNTASIDTTDHGISEGNIDYTITKTGTNTTLTYNYNTLTHGLGGTITNTTPTWYTTDHTGNLTTTLTLTGTQTQPTIDENGNTTNQNRYTWATTHTKTRHHTGLITLTTRNYNPQTHQFLQTDPITGGTPNPYTYPTDPINHQDMTGAFDLGGWINNAWNSAVDWVGSNREAIVRFSLSVIATAVSTVLIAGICGASAGIGCFILAGATIGGLHATVAQLVTDRIFRHRITQKSVIQTSINQSVLNTGSGVASFLTRGIKNPVKRIATKLASGFILRLIERLG